MFCRNPASQRALDLVKKKKKKDVIHCCYEIIIVYFYHKKYFMLRLQSKLQRLYLKLILPKKSECGIFTCRYCPVFGLGKEIYRINLGICG